jgi:hypothetical protein
MDDDLAPRRDGALVGRDPLDVGTELLAGIDSWASLATHLVRQYYVAGDPGTSLLREPGAAKEVTGALRALAARMRRHVSGVCELIGSSGFIITAGVPAGLQLALQWTAPAAAVP